MPPTLAASGLVVLQRWLQQDHLRRAFGFEDALGALAAILGTTVVLWWLVSLLLAVVSGLLALSGRRRSAELTGRLAPRFMRRLVLAVLGFNLLASGVAQAAEPPVSPLWQPTGQVATAPAQLPAQPPAVSPLWQPQAPMVSPGPLARPESRSIFDRFTGGDPTTGAAARAGVGAGVGAVASPGAGTAPASASAAGTRPVIGPGADVVVRTGDSLWTLAAEQLGPLATDLEIAEQWPRWFQANRGVIGDDPSLLLPGQILRAP